ncbi:MAG: virulence RhuM family protein [Anaerovoracaceae bacterium]
MKKGIKEKNIRSSAAEYLTFVAATGNPSENLELRYEDENIWVTQKIMATMYDVSVSAINQHIKSIFLDDELDRDSVIKYFLITASDGKSYKATHYSLSMIIAVGFKVNSQRAVRFRKWVNQIAKEYTIQGWTIDDERIINGGSILTEEYYEKLLVRIREIRLSERKFSQKITDIYSTAVDYDKTAKTTKIFYAKVQNKMHFAIHGKTAAEVIFNRADAEVEHMGLKTWELAPEGKIQKYDVTIAKNYLQKEELASLQRIVNAYLEVAEDMAIRNIPMSMEDWASKLDIFLNATGRGILQDAGSISAEIAREHAETEFEKYRIKQDKLFKNDFDRIIEKISIKKD